MKKTSHLGCVLLIGLMVALLVPTLAKAQLLPTFEKEADEAWKWSVGFLWGQTSEELLNTSQTGFIIRGPDFFRDHSFETEGKIRNWHPHWSIFYMRATGGEGGTPPAASEFQESEIWGFLFGSDYVLPGQRLYFTGGVGLYNVISTRWTSPDSISFSSVERSDLDVGGWFGAGWKLGTNRLWSIELSSHYFQGNNIFTLGTQYRW